MSKQINGMLRVFILFSETLAHTLELRNYIIVLKEEK